MALKSNVNNSHNLDSSNTFGGYLVCFSCSGYYELKAGESPGDFEECECGGELQYFENIDKLFLENDNSDKFNEDINDVDVFSVIDNLTSKAEKRKEVFKELSKRVEVQEDLLNKIKQGKSSLLDEIDEKNLSNDIGEQKLVLQDIIEEEEADLEIQKELLETLKDDQNKLLELADDKRYKKRSSMSTIYIGSVGIDQRFFILIIVLILIIVGLYIIL